MPKKLIISLLLLMLIASVFAFFILSQSSQEPSIQILPNKKIHKEHKDKNTSTMVVEINLVKPNITDALVLKESKFTDRLEILGTITNPDGEVLSDVLVLAKGEFPPTYTDANGQYHLVLKKSELTNLLLNFSLSGYEKQRSSISINEFETSANLKRDIILAKALDTLTKTTYSGIVSNRIGEGIADQRVHLITLGDFSESEVRYIEVAVTDQNGKFILNDVSINTYYQLVILAGNGYDRIEVDNLFVTKDMPDADIIVEDIKLITISGQVVDREGVPMPHLKLIAKDIANNTRHNTADNRFSRNLETDNSGVFQLENFPEGEVTFSITSPTEIEISGIMLNEMNSQNLLLTIDSGSHFVSGVVSDSDGTTIADATVTLQSTYSKNEIDSHSVRYVNTDSSGVFTFEKFGADIHFIYISHKDFKHKRIVHQPHTSETHLNIILERL